MFRRGWASGKFRYGAWRVVRLVEVESEGSIVHWFQIDRDKARGTIGGITGGFVPKHKEQARSFRYRVEPPGFSIEVELGVTRTGLMGNLIQDIDNRYGLSGRIGNESRFRPKSFIARIALTAWKVFPHRRFIVGQAQNKLSLPYDDVHPKPAQSNPIRFWWPKLFREQAHYQQKHGLRYPQFVLLKYQLTA